MPLPAPRTWANGEEPANIPTADALNLDWRDSFDFLLGTSRPFIFLAQSTTQSLTGNVFGVMAWQTEIVKRGGMTHATNATSFTVPYTGQYIGFVHIGLGTLSSLASRTIVHTYINATIGARFDMSPLTTVSHQLSGSLTLDMTAGDAVTVEVRNTQTVSTSNDALLRSKIALWYSGDFS